MLLQVHSFELELHRYSIFLRVPSLIQMFWSPSLGLHWDWLINLPSQKIGDDIEDHQRQD